MSNDAVAGAEDTAPGWSPRQADRVNRVLDAAVQMLRESSYSGITVRAVADRAGVSTATAYNYFSSKNALIAEVYLRWVRSVPLFVDVNQSTQQRVTEQLHELALLVADEPEVAAATSTALMGDEPELIRVRDKIAWEVRRRIAAALGPGEQDDVLLTLELIFYGALVRAGTGYATYQQVADKLDDIIALILAGAGHDSRVPAQKKGRRSPRG
jgi:AcrR family transcriptional regulator